VTEKRGGGIKNWVKHKLLTLSFGQFVFSGLTTVAAIIGVFTWVFESPDRELGQKVQRLALIASLEETLDQAIKSPDDPYSGYRLGRAIQQLSDLGEPAEILGREVSLRAVNLSCIESLTIKADRIIINGGVVKGSRLNLVAEEVFITDIAFIGTPVLIGLLGNNPSESVLIEKSIFSDSEIHFDSISFAASGNFFDSSVFGNSDSINFAHSFFLNSAPLTDGLTVPEAEVSFTSVGIYFTKRNLSELGFSIESTSSRIQALAQQIDEIEAAEIFDPKKHAVCVYSEVSDINLPDHCPPQGRYQINETMGIFEDVVGMDAFFRHPESEFPFYGIAKHDVFKLTPLDIGNYFDEPFAPSDLTGGIDPRFADPVSCER